MAWPTAPTSVYSIARPWAVPGQGGGSINRLSARRVTHLTVIDARVVLGFMEIVSESNRIVPGRRLMIY
jgi:hypothetical protein